MKAGHVLLLVGVTLGGLVILALAPSLGILWQCATAGPEVRPVASPPPAPKAGVDVRPEGGSARAQALVRRPRLVEDLGKRGEPGEVAEPTPESKQAGTPGRGEDVPAEVKLFEGLSMDECINRLGPPRDVGWYLGPLPSSRLYIYLSMEFDTQGKALGAGTIPWVWGELTDVEHERVRAAGRTETSARRPDVAFPDWVMGWDEASPEERVALGRRMVQERTLVGHSFSDCTALLGGCSRAEWWRDFMHPAPGPDRLKGIIPGGWAWIFDFDLKGQVCRTAIEPPHPRETPLFSF